MVADLRVLRGVEVTEQASLAAHTRFGLGGPARLLVDARIEEHFITALNLARASGAPYVVLGGGSNLLVADAGFPGTVLRYRGGRLGLRCGLVTVESGAELQALVDYTIDEGRANLHTMTRIPGWVGAAIYGNAGAYGHSIMESIHRVRFHDGAEARWFTNAECEFTYRESIFKRRKDWIVLAAELAMPEADPAVMRQAADEIRATRDAKYPPTMKCAGSIFKNCLFAQLPAAAAAEVPPKLVRDGKVPSAWFLEQAGVKGIRRGDIQVAEYHANLIYNDGPAATAADVRAVIVDLKQRVFDRFGFWLEEEVQYVGFPD
ncbi:MAG: UDP-N-acetylmuramate dehydrogenase [Bryobacterales bacterium]|nr:UDP-N-acetylmuramate dehydrogenase [Bryobacterales bacterium]